jgi:hypothetical protein
LSEVKINPLYSTFNFVGTLNLFKDKGKFYSSNADDATAEYLNSRVNFAIKTSDTNMIFVELSGGYKRLSPQDIKTMDKDKNKMEVKWSDRKNPEILKDVANWRAVRINLQDSSLDDCQKFLCSIGSSCYDAVEYLKTTLQDGTRVYISGNKEYSRYKNKEGQWRIGIKYIPNIIRLAKDDEEDKAEGVESFIFDKDSWDEGVLKTEKKVYINGYTTCYDRTIGEKGETIFIPVMYTLNCEALDFENEQHTRIFNYFKDCFKASKKEYKATQWHCYIKRGFNMQEITMDDLNEDQKIQIQIGLKTLDEIAKEMRNGTISEKIDEVQLYAPTNGMKDNTVSELTQYVEEDFFIPESAPKEEKLTDVQEKTEDDKTSTVSETYKSLFPMK